MCFRFLPSAKSTIWQSIVCNFIPYKRLRSKRLWLTPVSFSTLTGSFFLVCLHYMKHYKYFSTLPSIFDQVTFFFYARTLTEYFLASPSGKTVINNENFKCIAVTSQRRWMVLVDKLLNASLKRSPRVNFSISFKTLSGS